MWYPSLLALERHGGSAGALFLLWVILAFVVGFGQKQEGEGEGHNITDNKKLESSTWLACLFLFAVTGLFLYIQGDKDDDALMLWNMVFELQVVGVPLTVLMLAAMGMRSYSEIIIHFLLLSAAVNSLWLQVLLQGSALYTCKLLTVALPSISVYMTHAQLPMGAQHIVTGMAAVALIPLFVMPVILNNDDPSLRADEAIDKFQLRLSALCSSAALFATIVNLAQL